MLEKTKVKLLKQSDDEKRANIVMSRMVKQTKKQYQVAYKCCGNLWRIELHNIVSAIKRVQDLSLNQLKLKVKDTSENDFKK